MEDPSVRLKKEHAIEQSLNIPEGHVILDIHRRDLLQAEPRIQETEIPVVDDMHIEPLSAFTPVADAIRMRSIPDWDLMIITDEEYRDIISNHAHGILFE